MTNTIRSPKEGNALFASRLEVGANPQSFNNFVIFGDFWYFFGVKTQEINEVPRQESGH